MRRTNIYLSEDQLATLQALGGQRGIAMSELVRQAIDEWLRAQGVRVLTEDEWGQRFDALLSRRRVAGGLRSPSPSTVDRDVSAAVREVRRARAARRR
jgi:hypothetical protein